MSAPSDISISGTFENLLNNGARTQDCIGEELDNSIDAGSTMIDIRLLPEKQDVIISDNGRGMNRSELKTAYILNNRTNATNDKQGRFGYGINLSKAHLTQLKSKVTTISKTTSDEFPNQIEIDWPEIIRNNYYMNVACEVTRANEVEYNRCVKDAFRTDSGTVHIVPCEDAIFKEIYAAMKSSKVINSWRYLYGVKYNDYINAGLTIRIIDGDEVLPVVPVDPLAINILPEDRRRNVLVEIYKDNLTGEILPNIPGRGWILSDKPKFQQKMLKTDPLPTSFNKVADLTVESAITFDWATAQCALFEGDYAFDTITKETTDPDGTVKQHQHQPTVEFMGGRYYNRNKKNIAKVPIHNPTSGDKARYPYVTNSRHRISFPVELDSYMGIQVNKSKIQEDLIHPSIKRICDMLEKEFVDKHYNPTTDPESEPDTMTKSEAMKILERLMEFFDELPEQKQIHVDKIIDVIVKMVGKSNKNELIQRTRQWKLVAERDEGIDTIIEIMAYTIESQKDAAVVSPESLNALLASIGI
jgi:hypothetical protein